MRSGSKGNFRFKKSLGQNFLRDEAVLNEIAEKSGIEAGDTVVEIGPGSGALTAKLSPRCKRLIAVEIDKALIPLLEERFSGSENVGIINADILKFDLNKITAEAEGPVRVVGNLPYYITTPIIIKLLRETGGIKSITAMMQKEVAERFAASPGGKDYGSVSLLVQYYCSVEKLCDVSPEAFFPRPKVESRVLRLDILEKKPVELADEELFFALIRAGFAQRRKTLLNSLSAGLGREKAELLSALEGCGIEPERRAETLDMEEFARLSDRLAAGGT